ncbi:MAG: hypothetical protein ACP5VS_08255 [Desulfomonilaceae bacterium]
MLREHINDIRTRWSPKQRAGSPYDPHVYLESPEQARKLINYLKEKLIRARKNHDRVLAEEISETLLKVENLSRKFFRWEESISNSLNKQDLKEINELPVIF